MTSSIDLQRMAQFIPEGVKPGTDLSSFTVGTVTGLDIPAGQVQVSVDGGDPVWVPAAPFVYAPGVQVRLRRSPLDGGRVHFCEGPYEVTPALATGVITAVGADTLTVTVLGDSVTLPFVQSTYSVSDEVWVLRHPSGFGEPLIVLGLAGAPREQENPGGGDGNPSELVSRQATFGPQDSGSWRQTRWDNWNQGRYGGVSTLYQGSAYGSGPMVGWAGHGDQVTNLQAEVIDKMWVDVVRADESSTAGKVAVVQGSPNGNRPGGAPSGTGDTASSPSLTPGQHARVELPASTYEAWRTGAIKGLITVGGDYAGFFGTARGGAMAITVQYRVRA